MREQESNDPSQREQDIAASFSTTDSFLQLPLALPSLTLEMLATLLELSPDAVLVSDASGTIVLLNALVKKIFGYRQEELPGRSLEVLVPERWREAHLRQRLSYLTNPSTRPMGAGLDLMGRRKDGSDVPVDISLRPVLIQQTLYILSAIRDRTSQYLCERELRKHHQLLNFSHDAILMLDPDIRIRSWNRGAEELYGWTASEAIGRGVGELLSTTYPQPLESILPHFFQEGHWDGDLIHHCRDGREIIVESRWAFVHDESGQLTAILEINRDVTERRRLTRLEQEARAQLAAHLEVLQQILNQLPMGICLVRGTQVRLLLANQEASKLWGAEWIHDQPMEDFLKTQQVGFLAEDGQPLVPPPSMIEQVMASGEPVFHRQLVIRQPDGTSLPVMLDIIPLDNQQVFAHFPSDRVSSDAVLERVVMVVHQDVTALKEAEAVKDQFISMAAHELRTPVTVLAGYADLLLRQAARSKEAGAALEPAHQGKLQAMKEATRHLTKLTEDLLEVTRVQTKHYHLERQPANLIALTRQVIERLQTTTTRHQIRFQTTLERLDVSIDTVRIEQVLSNLLSNAIKYSPESGEIEVEVWSNARQREACVRVSDHGMGIPQTQQATIFGRFVRADNVRSAHIPGTGLGLYLCRELVERHGGRIWFASQEQRGTTFFFTLPCELPA